KCGKFQSAPANIECKSVDHLRPWIADKRLVSRRDSPISIDILVPEVAGRGASILIEKILVSSGLSGLLVKRSDFFIILENTFDLITVKLAHGVAHFGTSGISIKVCTRDTITDGVIVCAVKLFHQIPVERCICGNGVADLSRFTLIIHSEFYTFVAHLPDIGKHGCIPKTCGLGYRHTVYHPLCLPAVPIYRKI